MKNNLLVFILFSIALSGCTKHTEDDINLSKRNISKTPIETINAVVLIKQNDNYSCATTSAAMILSEYEGLHSNPLNQDHIWNISGSSINTIRTSGNDITGLINICNNFQYKYAFVQNITNEEAEYLLSKKIYLTIFINLNETTTHAVVLTGYNKLEKIFYVNDPNGTQGFIPYPILEKHWFAKLAHPNINSIRAAFIIFPKEISINYKSFKR